MAHHSTETGDAVGLGESPRAPHLIRPPDLLSALRIPLAVAFVVFEGGIARFAILVVAGASDLADGFWARRIGSSRIGVVLDAVVDKLFMATAFFVVWRSGVLSLLEVAGALLRDILAALGFLATVLFKRPTTIPSRAGGKAVTACQLLALVAFVAGSDFLRPLVWATAAVSLYAMADYGRQAARR